MKTWTIIERNTGRVLRSGGASNMKFTPRTAPGEAVIEGVRLTGDEFVVDGKPVQRPDLPIAGTIEAAVGEIVIGELPAGTKIYKGSVYAGEAVGGILKFRSTKPGSFTFKFVPPFPFREKTVAVLVDKAAIDAAKVARAEEQQHIAAEGLTGLQPTPSPVRSNP